LTALHRAFWFWGLALVLAGCAPTLDWREVRVGAAESVSLFPCKPSAHAREVSLGQQRVKLTLHACQAGGATWGLAWADVTDPAQVAPALRALLESARANLGEARVQARPFNAKGQTPHPAAGRWALQGRYPDGQAVSGHVAVFSRGTVVFQATVLGVADPSEPADTFLAGLRFGS
jgi:hypothetical protein